MTSGQPSPALSIRNISKVFRAAKVLADVSLDIMPGEVHGLLGQNGSGKSTLIKILSGFHEPEPGGSMQVDGVECSFPMPAGEARKLGISCVHQHLGLVSSLTVLENMMVGDIASQPLSALRWREARARVRDTFARFGLEIDPNLRVGDLAQVDRALVAIVRAFEEVNRSGNRGILILDEPTPFLPRAGVDRLFALVRQVASQGTAVIFVSHDIDEIFEITDRASVLRDGSLVATIVTAASTREKIVDAIVGRKVEYFQSSGKDLSANKVAVEIEAASDDLLSSVSLSLRAGEVVGLTGLIGAGFDRLMAVAYGASHANGGQIRVGSNTIPLETMTPAKAMRSGIAFLPADRLGAAGAANLTILDNVTLPILRTYDTGIFLDWRRLDDIARQLCGRFEVRPNEPSLPFGALSGGNAQKVVLAKWLQTNPSLLLLDEPVQGVDVGARQRILSAISAAADEGAAVLVASTDAEMLAQICDRVLVFARGSVATTLTGERLTKTAIAEACLLSTANSQMLGSSGALH